MTDFIFLGEDLGMGANKLHGAAGGLQTISQVSSNGTQAITGMVGLKARTRPLHIATQHGSFYIGDGAHSAGRPVENLNFDRLTGTPEMRALFYGSLTQYQREYGPFERPLRIVAGLPVKMMIGETSRTYQDSVKAWLKGVHEFEADGVAQRVEVAKVILTSQPVGALFDYAFDDAGEYIPGREDAMLDEFGVVSVGFNTLELLVVQAQVAADRFVAGNTVGVRRLLELIDPSRMYSLGELDAKLRGGRLKAEIKTNLPLWASDVTGEIEDRWGDTWKRFSRVLIVGGGALLLRDVLTAYFGAKAWIPENAVGSIARGLYKLNILKG